MMNLPLTAAALALALCSCASTKEEAPPVAEQGKSAGRTLGGDFKYDDESGSMVSTKGDSPYDKGDFNPGAGSYDTKTFDGGSAYAPDSFSQRTKAYSTRGSDYQSETYAGGDSRYEGERSRFAGKTTKEQGRRYKGVDVPVNPYERSSAMLGNRDYEPARRSQSRSAASDIISSDPNGPPEHLMRRDTLSEADVRTLLNKN